VTKEIFAKARTLDAEERDDYVTKHVEIRETQDTRRNEADGAFSTSADTPTSTNAGPIPAEKKRKGTS